jgi:antitoxin component YwqK of YwqJK toxin-antitoxin module
MKKIICLSLLTIVAGCKNEIRREYYPDGTLKKEVILLNRADSLVQITDYYKSGAKECLWYKRKGSPDSVSTEYYENGKVQRIRHFINGQLYGKILIYDSSGIKQAEILYEKGILRYDKQYWENGIVKAEHYFNAAGQQDSTWMFRDSNGKLKGMVIYKNDSLIREITY